MDNIKDKLDVELTPDMLASVSGGRSTAIYMWLMAFTITNISQSIMSVLQANIDSLNAKTSTSTATLDSNVSKSRDYGSTI